MSDDTELRDRLAGLCGWAKNQDGAWHRGDILISFPHPFPPNDLTALAAAWPGSVALDISYDAGKWIATAAVRIDGKIPSTVGDTIYAALLPLTVAVLEAMK